MSTLSRFKPSESAPETPFERDLERSLDIIFTLIGEILNGGILLEDNFNGFKTTITTSATPGTETAIAHGLKRTPIGYIVLKKDKAAHIYDGSTAFDSSNIYVRSDVASVTVTLFIL
jgi:hypothetical protein